MTGGAAGLAGATAGLAGGTAGLTGRTTGLAGGTAGLAGGTTVALEVVVVLDVPQEQVPVPQLERCQQWKMA